MKTGNNLLTDLIFISNCILKPMQRRCLYIGWTGHANLGDEALREAIFNLFASKLIFIEKRGALVRLLEKFKFIHFDVLMLGGGTLILRSQKILDALRESHIPKKVIFGTGVANQVFWKDIPDSYGDFSQWKELLENVDYLGVRGPISKQLLNEIGLKRDFPVIGDPVLYFTRPIRGIKVKKKKLGVNIGTAQHPRFSDLLWGRNEKVFVEEFSKFLRVMLQDGWEIEVIPVYPKDMDVINTAIKLSGGEGKIKIFQDYHSVSKTLDRMEQYDIFVGQKLHSVVLAYCANTPAIMIEYRPKCRDFMASIGMENFNLKTDEFCLERITPLFTELYDNLEKYRVESNRVCLDFKSKIESNVENVMIELKR